MTEKRLIILAVMCLLVSACGIKPGGVKPPSGTDNDKFPHTYPNPSTDPK